MGGTVDRMKNFAEYLRKELQLPDDGELQDLTGRGHRYSTYTVGCSVYKFGCVLCVNVSTDKMMFLRNAGSYRRSNDDL